MCAGPEKRLPMNRRKGQKRSEQRQCLEVLLIVRAISLHLEAWLARLRKRSIPADTKIAIKSSRRGRMSSNLLPSHRQDRRLSAKSIEVVGARCIAVGPNVCVVRIVMELAVPGHRQDRRLSGEVVVIIRIRVALFVFQIFGLRHHFTLRPLCLLILWCVWWWFAIEILLIVRHLLGTPFSVDACWVITKKHFLLILDFCLLVFFSSLACNVAESSITTDAQQQIENRFKIAGFSLHFHHPPTELAAHVKLALELSPNMDENAQPETATKLARAEDKKRNDILRLSIVD